MSYPQNVSSLSLLNFKKVPLVWIQCRGEFFVWLFHFWLWCCILVWHLWECEVGSCFFSFSPLWQKAIVPSSRNLPLEFTGWLVCPSYLYGENLLYFGFKQSSDFHPKYFHREFCSSTNIMLQLKHLSCWHVHLSDIIMLGGGQYLYLSIDFCALEIRWKHNW